MCSVTGAWVQADVFGLRPRLVFGGGTLHIMSRYKTLQKDYPFVYGYFLMSLSLEPAELPQ